jgi:hypothetical protein
MLHKVSCSLSEYLNYLNKMHYDDTDNNWGFYIDIEKYKQNPFISRPTLPIPIKKLTNKLSRIFSDCRIHDRSNKIKSHKSIINLNESCDSLIFKMDDDDYVKPNKCIKIDMITNICIVSSIILFLFII